jgi:hypothetical protein
MTAIRNIVLTAALSAFIVSCAGSNEIVCKRDPATGESDCNAAGANPAGVAVTTGVAAGVFGIAGCTVNGCQLPDRCNPKTKRCETIRCGESAPCPAGYSCDLTTSLCR